MEKFNKIIAKAIVMAQMCSDSGKYIDGLNTSDNQKRYTDKFKYNRKVFHEVHAIKLINTNNSFFNYYVKEELDQNKFPSIIVYFGFKVEGKKYQVSFHNPTNRADELKPFVGKGFNQRWDKKNSRETCQILIDYFNL